MKLAGQILIVFAALLFWSALKLIFFKYDLRNSLDVSRACGAMAAPIVVGAIGAHLLVKSRKR